MATLMVRMIAARSRRKEFVIFSIDTVPRLSITNTGVTVGRVRMTTARKGLDVDAASPCCARQSLNILVDDVTNGAGEAVRRRPKSISQDICAMVGPNESTNPRTKDVLGCSLRGSRTSS